MTGVQDRPSGDGALESRPPGDEAPLTLPTTLTPTSEHAKHWAKAYRTGIASGASSVLSTITAVSSSIRPYQKKLAHAMTVSPRLNQDTNAGVRVTFRPAFLVFV